MIQPSSSIRVSELALSLTAPEPSPKKISRPRKRFQDGVEPHSAALVLDAEGTIQHITPAARRLLEYRHDDDLPPCFFSHVHGRNMYQVMRDVADMVCYGKPRATWLLRMRTGRGRWQWVRATVSNLLQGDVPAIKVVVSDLQES